MINTNELILDELTDSEYFLLSIFASYGKVSHPCNDVLTSRTKWDFKKVKKYRAKLIDKGFLVSSPRYQIVEGRTRRASNKYEITTDLMKKFNGKNKKSDIVNTEVRNLRNQIEDLKKQIASLENAKATKSDEIEIEKPKKPIKESAPKVKFKIEDLEYPEDFGEDLKLLLAEFIEYKSKEKKQYYKTIKSLQRVANEFYKGAKKHGIISVRIALDSTKLNQYTGIFINKPSKQELETYGKQAEKTNGTNYRSAEQGGTLQDKFNDRFGDFRAASSSSDEDNRHLQEFD